MKKTHGGRRKGAGRRPTAGAPYTRRTVALTAEQIAAVEAYQARHVYPSWTAALRRLLDLATATH